MDCDECEEAFGEEYGDEKNAYRYMYREVGRSSGRWRPCVWVTCWVGAATCVSDLCLRSVLISLWTLC